MAAPSHRARAAPSQPGEEDAAQLLASLARGLAAMPNPALVVGPSGDILSANHTALDILGFSRLPESARSLDGFRRALNPRYPSGQAVPLKAWPPNRAIRGETFRSQRVWVTTGNGQAILLSFTGGPVLDEADHVVGGVMIAREVTEERRKEARQAAIFRVALALGGHLELPVVIETVMEQAQKALRADAVMLWQPDLEQRQLRLLAQRGLMEDMRARLQTLSFDTPTPAARVAISGQIIALENLTRAPAEYQLSRELGQRHGFKSLVSLPLVANDQVVGVMSFSSRRVRHFTAEDLKTVETIGRIFAVALGNALAFDRERELRAELEAVIQSSPEAILFLKAPDGEALLANAAAETILGREIVSQAHADEHVLLYGIYRPNGEPFEPEEAPSFETLQGKIILGLEAIIHHASGREVPVLINAAQVKDREGKLIGAVVLFQDISLIRQLEAQREELVAIVAHDLRAPLTIIVGYADLLQRLSASPNVPPEARQALEAIRTSARRLNRLIEDLLDIARLQTNRLALQPKAVDLPRLVRGLVDRLGEVARNHPVRVDVVEPMQRVWADPGRTDQVLTNLLSNAAKYSSPNSEIVVRVAEQDSEAVVSVTDRGPGISPADISRIFERGYRAAHPEAEEPEGLGLGLHISRQLVEAQGGRIWVESQPGVGSAFYFTLPLERPPQRPE